MEVGFEKETQEEDKGYVEEKNEFSGGLRVGIGGGCHKGREDS